MKALGFGAVLWDQIPTASGPHRLAIGGAVFNVMAHLSRLGEEAALVSAVGKDALGDDAVAEVAASGVADRWIGRGAARTCEVEVLLDARGEPSYRIPERTSWDAIKLGEAALSDVADWGADSLFYGTIEQRDPTSRATLQRLIAGHPRARLFVDLNLRPPHSTPDAIDYSLRHCTDLKLNEEEAGHVAGLVGWRWSGLESFCAAVAEHYAIDRVVVTAGAAGCYFFDGAGYGRAAAYPVGAANLGSTGDSVGAGDAFMAGLAHRLWAGHPLHEACDFANRLGALVASRSGALPPYSLSDLADVGRR